MQFPWSKPTSTTAKARKSNGFDETIPDSDYLKSVERNQAASCIVVDVASDAVNDFTATPNDKEIHALFEESIRLPLTSALLFTRMYGYCGILVGYADDHDLSLPVDMGAPIEYLQPIPKNWIEEIIYTKENGQTRLPLTVDKYRINVATSPQIVDESRMILLSNPCLDAASMAGEPSLKCVWDLLTVLKSMDWGVGQAMWRHGGGLTAFVVADSRDQQTQIDAIDDLVVDINAMTTLTLPFGTQMLTEGTTGLNPEPYYKVVMQQISMGTRIPMSILVGSQSGTLTASMKDRKDYYEMLGDVQADILTPALVDILTRYQESGQLAPGKITIEWDEAPDWILDEGTDALNMDTAEDENL